MNYSNFKNIIEFNEKTATNKRRASLLYLTKRRELSIVVEWNVRTEIHTVIFRQIHHEYFNLLGVY